MSNSKSSAEHTDFLFTFYRNNMFLLYCFRDIAIYWSKKRRF